MNTPIKIENPKALLLGMVFSPPVKAKYSCVSSQVPRDRIRCVSLEESLKMSVFTLDDKHATEQAVEGKHCQGNIGSENC